MDVINDYPHFVQAMRNNTDASLCVVRTSMS